MSMKKSFCMVGNFPPPLNGANLCSQGLADLLGSKVFIISLSKGTEKSKLSGFLDRLVNILLQYYRFVVNLRSFEFVYFQMYAGNAILSLLPFILVSRLFGRKIYLHTNSQMHYRKKHSLTNLAINLAGNNCCLVAQHESQIELGLKLYSFNYHAAISNIAFVDVQGNDRAKLRGKNQKNVIIGMLSNLTEEKGILRLAEAAIRLKKVYGIDVDVDVAGPFSSNRLQQRFVDMLAENDIFPVMRGLLSRDKVTEYLDSLDVFVMLTNYSVEAEPLVIYEAALRGVRVVAGDVGVVSGQIDLIGDGFCIGSHDIDAACQKIIKLLESDPDLNVVKGLVESRRKLIAAIPNIFSGALFHN